MGSRGEAEAAPQRWDDHTAEGRVGWEEDEQQPEEGQPEWEVEEQKCRGEDEVLQRCLDKQGWNCVRHPLGQRRRYQSRSADGRWEAINE